MLKDITLGQYFPTESIIHSLDPRNKIMLMLCFITVIFFIGNFQGYAVIFIFTAAIVAMSRIPIRYMLKGLKPLLLFIVITAVLNLFMTRGEEWFRIGALIVTYEGVKYATLMVLRIFFLIVISSILTLSTSPIMLTDGMEKLLSPFKRIGLPAHELAMMMSIALRFIPTLLEETDKIIKAQSSRGSDFESGGIIKRAKAMLPVLVPLFISAFRRADELATAMECRCYRGGHNRTRLKQLRYSRLDLYAAIYSILMVAAVIGANAYFGMVL